MLEQYQHFNINVWKVFSHFVSRPCRWFWKTKKKKKNKKKTTKNNNNKQQKNNNNNNNNKKKKKNNNKKNNNKKKTKTKKTNKKNNKQKKKQKQLIVCVFGFNVAFNNFSVISRRCLVATGSSVLTFIVLPYWSIMSQTLDIIPHPVTLSWHWVDQF